MTSFNFTENTSIRQNLCQACPRQGWLWLMVFLKIWFETGETPPFNAPCSNDEPVQAYIDVKYRRRLKHTFDWDASLKKVGGGWISTTRAWFTTVTLTGTPTSIFVMQEGGVIRANATLADTTRTLSEPISRAAMLGVGSLKGCQSRSGALRTSGAASGNLYDPLFSESGEANPSKIAFVFGDALSPVWRDYSFESTFVLGDALSPAQELRDAMLGALKGRESRSGALRAS
ncbi:hypothetical protein BDQ17DRAFT_1490063 [Cyathus striatus]|nr:hypothetical protein BDQ17DRAFT_1490063 [Cyathus striatus]